MTTELNLIFMNWVQYLVACSLKTVNNFKNSVFIAYNFIKCFL